MLIGKVKQATADDTKKTLHSGGSFQVWRNMPAPKRGEIVRQIGDQFLKYKDPLGKAVSYEMGKKPAGRTGKYRGDDRHLRFRGRSRVNSTV